jgi:hypothetical protein
MKHRCVEHLAHERDHLSSFDFGFQFDPWSSIPYFAISRDKSGMPYDQSLHMVVVEFRDWFDHNAVCNGEDLRTGRRDEIATRMFAPVVTGSTKSAASRHVTQLGKER